MDKRLHIICLNVPYPVNYGGVFDLFYKLPALQKQGINIHLHCFEYGRGEQEELNKYCEQVYYYPRNTGVSAISLKLPYIVSSRSSKTLINNLLQDAAPILIEGVHCSYLLSDKRFDSRRCIVRLHNVEFIYYDHLSKFSSSYFKKAYYYLEAKLLKKYEAQIANKAEFLTVTEKDGIMYQTLGSKKVSYLPLFLPPWQVRTGDGKGTFCLYQGDLSVPENEKAVNWLLDEVFSELNIPFVVAGKNPSHKLKSRLHKKNTVCLIENPDEREMQDLISKAHINLIPSFNATGIKLKLINALFNGRYCVANEATVSGSGLEAVCHIASSATDFVDAITELYEKPFDKKELQLRHELLDNMFDNDLNAKRLVEIIWR